MKWSSTETIRAGLGGGAVYFGFAALAVAWIVAGCEEADSSHPDPVEALERLRDDSVDELVATVNGYSLGAGEVRTRWRNDRSARRSEIVDAIVDREIAVQKGIERARPGDADLELVRKRAMVRALLREEVDREIAASDLDPEELERVEGRIRRRVGRPAGIRASHLLVTPASSEATAGRSDDGSGKVGEPSERERARRWSERFRGELPDRPELEDLFELRRNYRGELPDTLEIAVDANLAFPAPGARPFDGELPAGWMEVVSPFAEAAQRLLEEGREGELSAPIESRYGYHLILAHGRVDPRVPEGEAVREVAISKLLEKRRSERFERLVEQWVARASVAIEPGAFETSRSSEGGPNQRR